MLSPGSVISVLRLCFQRDVISISPVMSGTQLEWRNDSTSDLTDIGIMESKVDVRIVGARSFGEEGYVDH